MGATEPGLSYLPLLTERSSFSLFLNNLLPLGAKCVPHVAHGSISLRLPARPPWLPWKVDALPFPPQVRAPRLTADVQQVCEEERLLVEVLYGKDNRAIQAASECLLGAALVCDERLQHGTYHVQLEKEGRENQDGPPC